MSKNHITMYPILLSEKWLNFCCTENFFIKIVFLVNDTIHSSLGQEVSREVLKNNNYILFKLVFIDIYKYMLN